MARPKPEKIITATGISFSGFKMQPSRIQSSNVKATSPKLFLPKTPCATWGSSHLLQTFFARVTQKVEKSDVFKR